MAEWRNNAPCPNSRIMNEAISGPMTAPMEKTRSRPLETSTARFLCTRSLAWATHSV